MGPTWLDFDVAYLVLEKVGTPQVFCPWDAPHSVLEEAEVVLGTDYPEPIVDLSESRKRALEAYSMIR